MKRSSERFKKMKLEILCQILLLVLLNSFVNHCEADIHWQQRDSPVYDGDDTDTLLAMCPKGCATDCDIKDCDEDAITSLRKAQDMVSKVKVAIKNGGFLYYTLIAWIPLFVCFLMGAYLFKVKHFVWANITDANVTGGTGGVYHRTYTRMQFTVEAIQHSGLVEESTKKRIQSAERNIEQHVLDERKEVMDEVMKEGFGLGMLGETYVTSQEKLDHHFDAAAWELEKLGEVILRPMRLKKIGKSIESQQPWDKKSYYDVLFKEEEDDSEDYYIEDEDLSSEPSDLDLFDFGSRDNSEEDEIIEPNRTKNIMHS